MKLNPVREEVNHFFVLTTPRKKRGVVGRRSFSSPSCRSSKKFPPSDFYYRFPEISQKKKNIKEIAATAGNGKEGDEECAFRGWAPTPLSFPQDQLLFVGQENMRPQEILLSFFLIFFAY